MLIRNNSMHEVSFTIGDEHAVFLKGRIDIAQVDDQMLDRILGSVYSAIELCFQPAIRIGFASRFA